MGKFNNLRVKYEIIILRLSKLNQKKIVRQKGFLI